jgi:hypothetical protein
MSSDGLPDYEVAEILREPVPPTGTDRWRMWEERARALPLSAASYCLNALVSGPEESHYAALLVLRTHGYEAWAEGYGKDLIYRVREPGRDDWRIITPRDRSSE